MNIPLRWSGKKPNVRLSLRIYRSDGAARFWLGSCYEHNAPMERPVFGWAYCAMNIPLRWSGLFLVGIMMLRTYRSDGAEKNQMFVYRYGYTAPMERKKLNARLPLRIYRSDGAGCFWLGL